VLSLEALKARLPTLRRSLAEDSTFEPVYNFTFLWACEPGKKIMQARALVASGAPLRCSLATQRLASSCVPWICRPQPCSRAWPARAPHFTTRKPKACALCRPHELCKGTHRVGQHMDARFLPR
jgi:hypothetical protein